MNAGRELDALIAEKVMGHHKINWVGPVPDDAYAPYSTDIAAAWPLVEKFGLTVQPIDQRWAVGKKDTAHGIYWDEITEADTAPLAICLAALKAVGAQVPA